MPALMPVDKASARMLKAIKSGGFETTFPRRLTWGLKFLRMMPREVIFSLHELRDPLEGLSAHARPVEGRITRPR